MTLFFRNVTIKTSNKQIHITNTITRGPKHCCRCVRILCLADGRWFMYSSIIISRIFYAHSGSWLNAECVINIDHTQYTQHYYTQYTLNTEPFELNVISLFLFQYFFSNSVLNQVFAIKNKLNIMLSPPRIIGKFFKLKWLQFGNSLGKNTLVYLIRVFLCIYILPYSIAQHNSTALLSTTQ